MKRSAAVLVLLSACRPSTMIGPHAPVRAVTDEARATVPATPVAILAREGTVAPFCLDDTEVTTAA